MELPTTEQTVNELLQEYEIIRQTLLNASNIPSWSAAVNDKPLPSLPELKLPTSAKDNPPLEVEESNINGNDSTAPTATGTETLGELVSKMDKLHLALDELKPKMDKFQVRVEEKDAVTGNPRYGEKTQARVLILLQNYTALQSALQQSETLEGLDTLKKSHQEEQSLQWTRQEIEQAQARVEKERLQLEEQQARQQQQDEERETARRLAQEQAQAHALLRSQAEAARQVRLAEQQAERSWVESIPVGLESVRAQLQVLKLSTSIATATATEESASSSSSLDAQKTALKSLLQIFQQIQKHPEEPNFRRIRRDHVQFQKDIGRHKGGQEVLIAAGFTLGAIDDVPCFLSIEPNLETDMDKWSAWYDLLKATFEMLQKEQLSN
jgi:hypothetical protein